MKILAERKYMLIFAESNNKKDRMMNETAEKRRIYDVTLKGAVINILLFAAKLAAAIWGHSSAILADAVHSLSDLLTDIVVLISVKLGHRPKDKNHDYGHGKAETVATAIIGLVLLVVGIFVFYRGMHFMIKAFQGTLLEKPSYVVLAVALVSIILKEWAYLFTIRTARATQSMLVAANAWHHRSDAFTSIGTAIGIAGAIFLGERWRVLDPITSIIISIFILKVAVDITKHAYAELTEASLPDAVENEIAHIAKSEPEVMGVKQVLTRRVGKTVSIEINIVLPENMTVKEVHQHALHIEQMLKDRFGALTHVGIHVVPDK